MDKISRSLIKTLTYRLMGSILLVCGTYFLTENAILSLSIGGLEFTIKLIIYFLHERFWNTVEWGRFTGKIIWLTGLSGAGKTTIAEELINKLRRKGERVIILDGDNIRKIFPNTGFTREDRAQHIERVGRAAILMAKSGITVICSLISPFEEDREKIRNLSDVPFYLVHVHCDLDECIKRDTKGLYRKALNGEIENFTGISQEYEKPIYANITIDTQQHDVKTCVSKIIKGMK